MFDKLNKEESLKIENYQNENPKIKNLDDSFGNFIFEQDSSLLEQFENLLREH